MVRKLVVLSSWLCLLLEASSFTLHPINLPSSDRIQSSNPPNILVPNSEGLVFFTQSVGDKRRYLSTELKLVPVPDGFFTLTGIVIGLSLSVSRSMTRVIIENRAWENRLEEAREIRLEEDPTLTELDLRRQEAAVAPSSYGPQSRRTKGSNKDDDNDDEEFEYNMTEEEIAAFQQEFGVTYDPYYDEPYEEDELPDDIPFTVDSSYGDRRYENGEIFYFDKETGLYYRQGGKPRLKQFWEF